ncbi:unnamed protein product [Absidia cylindrospora]
MKWASKDGTSTTTCDDIQHLPSSPPKKKSMERLSRLFQKKSKHKKSLTDDMPEPPLYKPVSRHSSIHSTQSSYQPPSRINSTSKKGGDTLKRLTSLRPNNVTYTNSNSPPRTVPELQQELDQKRQLLEQLYAEKQQTMYDNQRQEQDLARLEQRTQDRITQTAQLQKQYDTHLASMRATSDDLQSIRTKLIQLQDNIAELTDRLLPHISPDHTCQSLSSFWLNLRQVIEPMCPLSPFLIRLLTEKFIMDVLVQNFNLSEIAGCACSDDYAQIALWFLDHDMEQQQGKQYPSKSNLSSSFTSPSLVSSSPSSFSSFSSLVSSSSLSESVIFSIRLRQQVASTVVAAQQHQEHVKQQLQQVVQGHWKYLYGGLAKAYPFIYQHDTALEMDVKKHFGAQIQGLVEQAVALGFAIKGMELDITAADVQEGTQLFDPAVMDDVQGNRAGVIQFCISPPFRIVNHHDPLVKGKVLCVPFE